MQSPQKAIVLPDGQGKEKTAKGGFLSLSARAVEAKMVTEKGKGTSLGKSGGKDWTG